MALKFTIISDHAGSLGAGDSIVLGVGGGSIGRAQDNDWVLPDPRRYLSSHHARVQFRDGNYYIEDTSSNGVFVNTSESPLGRRKAHALRDGDELRVGEYRIQVALETDTSAQSEASAVFPVNQLPDRPGRDAGRSGIGVALTLQDLFSSDPAPGGRARPGNPAAPPATTVDTGILAFDSGQQELPGRVRIPSKARREMRAAAQAVSSEGASAGVEAFCRGAGIEPRRLPGEASIRLLHLTGLLLREALAGLKGLALTQHEIRSESHIGIAPEDLERIALQGLPVEDLLVRLLEGHDKRELDAVLWLRDSLGAARRHDSATVRALRTALAEFVAVLKPVGPKLGAGIAERFQSITDMPDGKLPHLFAEAFARAFSAEFKRPSGGS